MLDVQIGPVFLFTFGGMFAVYGATEIVRAYRIASFDAWIVTVLPAAGAFALGTLLVWSGLRLNADASTQTRFAGPTAACATCEQAVEAGMSYDTVLE
jgi:hypothetical protein